MSQDSPKYTLTIGEVNEDTNIIIHSKIASRFYNDSAGNKRRVIQTNDQYEQLKGIERIENQLFMKLARLHSNSYQMLSKQDQEVLNKDIDTLKYAYATFLVKRERGSIK